jgi:hypothetical protein
LRSWSDEVFFSGAGHKARSRSYTARGVSST